MESTGLNGQIPWHEARRAAWALVRSPLGLAAAALGAALLTYATQVEWRWLRIVERRAVVPSLPPALEGLRVLHLSDLHIGGLHCGARHVATAQRLAAELVVVTGDLVQGNRAIARCAELLGGFQAPLGVWVVLGNHDYSYPSCPVDTEALVAALEARGVRVLRNQAARLAWRGAEFWLAGTDDPHRRRHDLRATLAAVPPGAFTVLLAHSPDGLADLPPGRVALACVGHTHGGQVRLPGLPTISNTRRSWPRAPGLAPVGDTLVHFHAGMGNIIPLRCGVRPEVARLTLTRGATAADGPVG
ncbi:MAG TPA: metallophosphoesterase [Chloroflexota bacterium]|jgi:predicted MPP superfamily phosphohydrolase|nr:metallophosphoesterase [Chloroflexota bacterium]